MSHDFSSDSKVPTAAAGSGLRATQMVGRSFRFAMHARRERSAVSWSYAWQEIAGVTGADGADALIGSLGIFVQSVDTAAARRIEVLPKGCPGLCRDECLAVSVIAAAQLGACPALKACMYALIENGHVEPCIRAADAFGAALCHAGQWLPSEVVCNPLALMPHDGGRMRFDA